MKCIVCKEKDVSVSIDLTGRIPHIWQELMCIDCQKEYEKNGESPVCLDCGKRIITRKDSDEWNAKHEFKIWIMPDPVNRCMPCRDKKRKRAEKEGICTLCYVNPQAGVIDKSGEITTFCMDCLKAWTQMCNTMRLNDFYNAKIGERIKNGTKQPK